MQGLGDEPCLRSDMLNRGDVCGMLRKMLTITEKAQEMLGEFADSADEGVDSGGSWRDLEPKKY